MMAKSKETFSDILRSVLLDEAWIVKDNLGDDRGPKNPANPPQKGRPKKKAYSVFEHLRDQGDAD